MHEYRPYPDSTKDNLHSVRCRRSHQPPGLLRVSLPITFGRRWVAPLLPAFIAQHPKIRVDARFADRYVDGVAEASMSRFALECCATARWWPSRLPLSVTAFTPLPAISRPMASPNPLKRWPSMRAWILQPLQLAGLGT
ncbi:LysR substrate-binding domain-containing protein [Pseudomonas sivasensis]|uniref:LysR substrate-binding domain-containing protein n=1 Tax=Pseudomonas sivasensis TaxID=1880678 RepID=UPI001F12A356|nr:LysR substrate-binding domain-containing protein [Pseudomonas sivasensis]